MKSFTVSPVPVLLALLAFRTLVAATTENEHKEGKTALCLGCTRGIGEAAARQLAARGINVVVTGRSVDAGTKIANDIGGIFVPCDIANRSQLENAFQVATKQYGGIDAVFANGGTEGEMEPLDKVSAQGVEKIGRVNALGTLHAYDLSMKAFLENGGGSLVFTSSIAAFANEAISSTMPPGGFAYYAGTKAISTAMTRSSAMLPASHNIRVNTIAPAVYDTQMVQDVVSNSSLAADLGITEVNAWAGFNPLLPGCAGDPNDAAAVAVEMLANTTAWPPSAVVVTDGPFSFESNVLSDSLGRPQVKGWGKIDVSLLRNAMGEPVDVTEEEIEKRIASCATESEMVHEL